MQYFFTSENILSLQVSISQQFHTKVTTEIHSEILFHKNGIHINSMNTKVNRDMHFYDGPNGESVLVQNNRN